MALPYSGAPTNFINATAASETLTGTAGNDQLKTFYGRVGSSESFMYGGLGDDTYVVLSSKDRVNENVGEGIDTVKSDWFYILSPNVENLILTGSLAVGATGNELNNIIVGNAGKNVIEGGLGDDELSGGAGNDMFVVAGNDLIMDYSDGDYFDLRAFTSLTSFAQVQSLLKQQGSDVVLQLSATDAITIKNLTVGALTHEDFVLASDRANYTLSFADEFDTLSLNLGTGSDGTWYPLFPRTGLAAHTTPDKGSVQYFTYLGDTGSLGQLVGVDPFSIKDGVVTIEMAPVAPSDQAKMYGYDYTSGMLNTIGSFSQTYGYFEIRAKLPAGQGLHDAFWMLPIDGIWPPEFDVVESIGKDPNHIINVAHAEDGGLHVAHAKQFTVETATTEFHTYGVDWEPDFITWYIDDVAVRTQPTPPGLDVPVYMLASLGGGGAYAGVPDETTPFPAKMEIDYIRAYASEHTLEKGVPFDKVGTSANETLYGTSLGDTLNGGLGDDKLYGGAGNDTLTGGGGLDLLDGGFGDDTFIVTAATDQVKEGGGKGIDTVVTALTKLTLSANLENLVYTGTAAFTGGGNGEANDIQGGIGNDVLTGSFGDDTLRGGLGADSLGGGDGNDLLLGGGDIDTLRGNAGDDRLYGEDGADIIKGDEGNDELFGGAGDDNLQGGVGNDVLDGGIGRDRMSGGTGDDLYNVDGSTDTVTELAGEGVDTVKTALASYTLSANVENLIFVGTGASIGRGNSSNNFFSGGSGADSFFGGAGDDIFVINNSGDLVTENASEGTDGIQTSLVKYTLGANVENLAYTGTAAFIGSGNGLSNVIIGGKGHDRLDGLGGADMLQGGLGNDTYVIDNLGDLVVELAGQGTDRVLSKVSVTLADNVENLQLSTSMALNGTGNTLANTLVGNGGINVLDGRGGADKLTGGAGNDVFQFFRGEAEGDIVTDFSGAGQTGGDVLKLVGYGTGAFLTQVGVTDQYTVHAGFEFGFAAETIRLAGVSNLQAGDYLFA